MSRNSLENTLRLLVEKAGVQRAAVAFHDYKTGEESHWNGGEYFHAASTMKLAVLLAVFKAVDEKKIRLDDPLHVRNRFIGVADGLPYRLERGRDADGTVHDRIGRNMHIEDLARQMITVSSNLATNLLLDFVGVEYARTVLQQAGIQGVCLRRGVEDTSAHEMGINNETTAAGLVRLCRVIQDATFTTAASSAKMLKIMSGQKFTSMIPAKLPKKTKVAHKTGEVSTACHDAGLIYLEGRAPYALSILTEFVPDKTNRHALVADLSEAVFKHLTES